MAGVGAWFDALWILLGGLIALLSLAAAIWKPTLLFYAYCAAIPFNFALPPGPAGTVARIVGAVFFVLYLVLNPGVIRPRTVSVAGWLFVGWSLGTVLWATDPQAAFSTWISVAQLFAITVLIASIVSTNPRLGHAALWIYSIAAAVTAALAILAYLGGTGIFSRATAFANQDPALFSSIVLPAVIILMGRVQMRSSRVTLRLVALSSLVLCVGALALSGTRSAWIGLLVATVVWVVAARERRQLLSVAALALGVLLVVEAVPGGGDFLTGRVGSSLSTGGSGRTDIWAVGLSILAAAPLVGVGFGNFSTAFTPYAIAHASASAAGGALVPDRAPHNVFLGTSVETGLIGGVLLVIFLAAALLPLAGGRTLMVVRAALIGMIVQAAFLDVLQQKQLWLILAISFGLGAAANRELNEVATTAEPDHRDRRPIANLGDGPGRLEGRHRPSMRSSGAVSAPHRQSAGEGVLKVEPSAEEGFR